MLLLEQDIQKKRWVNKKTFSEPERKFKTKNNKEYKFKVSIDNTVYGQQANNQILGLYYLVSWKNYLKKENT